MINGDALKTAIIAAGLNDDLEVTEKVSIQCMTFVNVTNVLLQNSNSENNIRSLAASYYTTSRDNFLAAKGLYTSYSKMISLVENLNVENILQLNTKQINEINNLYYNRVAIPLFNINKFDVNVYNVDSLSNRELEYLKELHYGDMSNIVKYYNYNYGIPHSNMKIYSSTQVKGNCGKVMQFSIDGVDSSQIYADIINKNISVRYYKVKCIYPYVEIIFY